MKIPARSFIALVILAVIPLVHSSTERGLTIGIQLSAVTAWIALRW